MRGAVHMMCYRPMKEDVKADAPVGGKGEEESGKNAKYNGGGGRNRADMHCPSQGQLHQAKTIITAM